MYYIIHISAFVGAFFLMEFIAWVLHKYIMHGFLWSLHKDHHDEGHKVLQRNDSFSLFFIIPSWLCIMLGVIYGSHMSVWIGSGIAAYGFFYFTIHEIFIHQRMKFFRNSDNWYLRGLRRAHKIHHKKINKEDGECFGMLIVPKKYFSDSGKSL